MVTQNMLRTPEGKLDFSERMKSDCDYSQPNQMPLTDQRTEIAPFVHTIQYKYHVKTARKSRIFIIIFGIIVNQGVYYFIL